jgi:cbb3-type cytochrome oxidase maturation protein
MEVLYLLIPLALVLVAGIVWALMWAIRSGQFDDMEGPAHRILMDEDEPMEPPPGKRRAKAAKPEEQAAGDER